MMRWYMGKLIMIEEYRFKYPKAMAVMYYEELGEAEPDSEIFPSAYLRAISKSKIIERRNANKRIAAGLRKGHRT